MCLIFSFKAADEGLPPPLHEDDNVADTKIRQSEALYDTLLAEEAAGQAKVKGRWTTNSVKRNADRSLKNCKIIWFVFKTFIQISSWRHFLEFSVLQL